MAAIPNSDMKSDKSDKKKPSKGCRNVPRKNCCCVRKIVVNLHDFAALWLPFLVLFRAFVHSYIRAFVRGLVGSYVHAFVFGYSVMPPVCKYMCIIPRPQL